MLLCFSGKIYSSENFYRVKPYKRLRLVLKFINICTATLLFHSGEFMFHALPKRVVFSLILVIFDWISHTKHPSNLFTNCVYLKGGLMPQNTDCRTRDIRQDYCEKSLYGELEPSSFLY